jgi:L-fuconolactonase
LIVDAHHHLWQPEHGYTWLDEPDHAPIRRPFTPADLHAELTAAGVSRTILVEGGRGHLDEAAELLGYADDTEAIAGVVAWADLTDPDLAATLRTLRGLRGGQLLVGIRSQVQSEADPDYLDRPDVRRGLAAVAAADLVFDLVIRSDQLPAAARAAQAAPRLRFVLDHLGKPHIGAGTDGLLSWQEPFAALAQHANVVCKLSGMVTEAGAGWKVADLRPFVSTAVREFGADRLMFGSDWPVCLLVADYIGVLEALRQALPALDSAQSAEIFAGTAIRTYRIVVA